MSAMPLPRLTPEQYPELERGAEFRSEYLDVEMFAMSGRRLAHAMIGVKLASALDVASRGRNCVVTGPDLRMRVAKMGPFFYPDATVCCGEPQLADDHKDVLLNPTAVFEVLSPSSEAYDRGKKFAAHRQIESLREHVLVSQTEPVVESYPKGPEDKWTLTEFTGTGAVCRLESIGCEIGLAAIYRDVPLTNN